MEEIRAQNGELHIGVVPTKSKLPECRKYPAGMETCSGENNVEAYDVIDVY